MICLSERMGDGSHEKQVTWLGQGEVSSELTVRGWVTGLKNNII